MAEVEGLLANTRLLSLTGAGGSGKTRLAVETASALIQEFPDGVWLVELAPLSDPSLVAQAIAETFEVREQPGTPLLESVIGHLSNRRLLLELDNCEHLIDASAQAADRLLQSCPDLRILATSREPLHVPGEVVFRVPPLSLPQPEGPADPSSLARFASVELFVERARAASPSFRLTAQNAEDVAALCSHLDGLPLAIELAASRVALFPVSTIVRRLDDRFRLLVGGSRTALSRQQTLQATLEWSYDLLAAEEQALLRSLSVFVGGIALDAAEQICGGEDREVLAALGQLVEKSLVILSESDEAARYRLLETVREYGLQRIEKAGELEQVADRHAEWFLQLAERANEALPRPDRRAALVRLELEHDNIRAALDRSLAADPPRALRIAGAMWGFWLWRGYLAEGRRWLDLALSRDPGRTATHANALLGACALSGRAGRLSDGIALGEESLGIYRELGDVRSTCRALHTLVGPNWGRDDLAGAERLYRESLAIATETGFDPGRASAMSGLGIVRWLRGDRREGGSLLEEALVLFRSVTDADLAPPPFDIGEFVVPQPETGGFRVVFEETVSLFVDLPSDTFAGVVLANLGMIARAEGDYAQARRHVEEALVVFETVGDERFIGQTLARLASIAMGEGDIQRARELLERSLEVRRASRDWRGVTLTEASLGNVATAEGDFEQARMLLQQSAETFLRRGDRYAYAATESHLAALALARGDRAEYRRLLEGNLAHVREIGRPRWIGWTLTQLAALARLDGDEERALELIDDALAIFRRVEESRGVEHCTAFRAARPERVLATVVFTDMVESTRTASELGDQRWRSRVEAFLELVRERVVAFDGREIDTAGDGMFCLFASPTQAIPCAQLIAAAARKLGAEVRIGIHTGECELVGEAVRGVAVHIGARVGAIAAPGEVLVTRTVRDLVMGSDIEFENRGVHALKGISGEWELFAVHQTEAVPAT